MANVLLQTTSQKMFGYDTKPGKFNSEVKLAITKDNTHQQFTIAVSGVRSFVSTWRWNFTHYIQLGFSASSYAAAKSAATVYKINGYSHYGFTPESGYLTSDSNGTSFTSKKITVNATNDGNCPAVYMYFRAYTNSGVYDNITDTYRTLDVYCSTQNLASTVIGAVGKILLNAPSISLKSEWVDDSGYIHFSATSDISASYWKYSLHNGSAWGSSTSIKDSSAKSVTFTVKPSPAAHSGPQYKIRVSATGNDKEGISNEVDLDWRRPRVSVFEYTPKTVSSTTANVTFELSSLSTAEPVRNWWLENWQYRLDNGTWTTLKSESTNKDFPWDIDVSSGSHQIQFRATRSSNKVVSEVATCNFDATVPSVTAASVAPSSRSGNTAYGNVSVKFSHKCNYSINSTSYSNTANANVAVDNKVTLNNKSSDSFTVYARRADFPLLTTSKTVSCDSRFPTFDASLTPSTQKQALLKASSAYWGTLSITKGSTSYGKSPYKMQGTSVSETINVDSNSNTSYTATYARDTYGDVLYATKTLYCDTSLPQITLSNVSSILNNITVTAKSDVPCKNWRVSILDNSGTSIKEVTMTVGSDNKSASVTVQGVPMWVPYYIQVTATKTSNNLTASIKSSEAITCKGGVSLFSQSNSEYVPTIVHVYTNSVWQPAIPYVFTSGKWQQAQ